MWAGRTAAWHDPIWYHAGTRQTGHYKEDGQEADHDIPAGAVVHKDVNEAWKHAIKHWDEGKSDFPRVYEVRSANVQDHGSHGTLTVPEEGSEVGHDHEKHPPLRSKYDEPDDPIMFHGTTKDEGDDDPEEITPSGGGSTFGPGVASPEHAYATPNLSDAWSYAEKRAENGRGGKPTVYRVTPKNPSDVEKDPGYAGDYSRANYEHDKRSPSGFDVLDEVPMSGKQEHSWKQSPFNDDAEDDEDDWYHEGARTAVLHNPTGEIRGHEPQTWYHGSPHEFEEFGEGGREHWNTYLGTHFSAQPEVATQFAHGGHHSAGELDDEPAGHVVHAKLHIRRPKTYRSEYEMDQAAHEWAHGKGMLIGKHIADHPEDYAEPEDQDEDDDWWNSDDYHDPDDEEREQIRQAHLSYAAREDKPFGKHESDFGFPSRRSWRPAATGWLNSHPQKQEIAEGFKNHLKSQGYDGIVYGNEDESHAYDRGQKHLPYEMDSFTRTPGHPVLDLPEVGEHNRHVPQNNISSVAFEPHQIEITKHEYKPEHKTWEQRHPQDLQQPLPGMERTSKRYYHGTTQEFEPGDLVTGEHELGRRRGDSGRAFVTGSPEAAHGYGRYKAQAQWAIGQDAEPYAYEVEPTGPIEPDDSVDDRFDAWRSTSPFRVVRKLDKMAVSAEEYAAQDAGQQDVWQTTTEGRTVPLCQYHRDAALGRDREANSLGAYYDLGQTPSGVQSGPEKGSCASCGSNTGYMLQMMTRDVSRHRDSAQPRKRRKPYNPVPGNKPFTPIKQSESMMRKQAHDASENEDLRHCPFCGSGKIIGRADGTVECEFCHHYFTVQVQPQFPNFPQTMNGMPMSIPGMPGQVETPSGVGPNGEDLGEGMPPGMDEQEGGVPSGLDEGSDETEDSEDTQAEPPPFAKASFKTVTGARLEEDDYVRHLAIHLAQDRDAMIALVREGQ
jgi:hypothetical protein